MIEGWFFRGIVLGVLVLISGCIPKKSTEIPALAPDITKWVAERQATKCENLEPRYRIAQGVRGALKVKRYRPALLQELTGSGNAPMTYAKAISFSARSARLLRAEMDRRCPNQKIKSREQIVYIPQGV